MTTEPVQDKRSSSSGANSITLTSEDVLRFRLTIDHIERCDCCRKAIVEGSTKND